jgi:predicted dithiol-disulfide oxidoreductase (DUF899 family)
MSSNVKGKPQVVDEHEWRNAYQALLAKEKALTRARDEDFGVTTEQGEQHGLSVYLRQGDDIFRTYFTTARGLETVGGIWSLLDLTPFGRQEQWEDSPAGWPQSPPYQWWHRHDEYEASND